MSNPERWQRFNPLPPEIHARIDALSTWLQQSDVQLAYLFGSLAADSCGHDVDLALLTRARPVYQYRTVLYELLGTQRLDLIDLGAAPVTLCFEIIRSGRLLYAVSDDVENDFETRTLQEHHDMAPWRRRQEKQLKENIAAWSSSEHRSSSA